MNQANKNFITNIIHLLANIIIGVLYTPYLVKSVGIIAYGVVPLALVINQYINVISLSLVNALTRFYSVEYRTGNLLKASKYFSTSIVVSIVFSLLFYPILHIGINNIDRLFDIPKNLLSDSIWLFRFTVVSFFISIISNCINTTLFADNRIDYVNYLKILRQASKFLLNILFFIVFDTNILYIGLANLFAEIAVLLLSIFFYKRTKPQGVNFNFKLYYKSYLFTMLSMVIWVLLQRFSDTFLYKIDSILMNLYFGMKMTGIIGAISEFGTYVISVTSILGSLFGPLLLISYSKKEYIDYRNLTVEGGYIVGLFSGLLCGILCGTSDSLLGIWLGNEYKEYGSWLIIKLVVIPYTTVGAIFANSYLYANHNKYPALWSLLIAALNVCINIIFLNVFKSILAFLIICLIFILIQGLVMNVCFYNHLYSGNLKRIIFLTARYSVFMVLVGFIAHISINIFVVQNMFQLIGLYLFVFCLCIVLLDFLFLSKKQRVILYGIIPIYKKVRKLLLK